ncbi:RPM1-interacting protein 4-like [Chenopodium quinoa]|uniref:RPM1-interacting protein 4-like n=1 Tax=Chenopodium quinoa TaxID=63459 RepID=UPI000B79115E|nr:RPM1-interacting protein 4-like [Chenopodium quinoa]
MPSKASNNTGNRSLPKFGEWDVNNPQSAEGFTVIFNTARDQKKNDKTNAGASGTNQSPNQNNQGKQKQKQQQNQNNQQHTSVKHKWLSCIFGK